MSSIYPCVVRLGSQWSPTAYNVNLAISSEVVGDLEVSVKSHATISDCVWPCNVNSSRITRLVYSPSRLNWRQSAFASFLQRWPSGRACCTYLESWFFYLRSLIFLLFLLTSFFLCFLSGSCSNWSLVVISIVLIYFIAQRNKIRQTGALLLTLATVVSEKRESVISSISQ